MTSNQQKINIKNTLKAQRKYLLPLYTKNQNQNGKESLQKTTKIEHSAPRHNGQQERVITLNIFNDFFDRLNNEKSRKNHHQPLPQIFKKRSLSVNISEHGAPRSISRFQAKRGGKLRKIETQISQQSPWQDLQSNSKITLVYWPLLGRRHTNMPCPIQHQSQAINTSKTPQDPKDQTSVIYYKHPLHQKCIRKQVLQTETHLFTGKIRNQSIKIQRHFTKVQRMKNNKKRFVKVCNAIIFIHYLRRYSRLYRAFRQKFMFELTIQRIKDQVSKFRQCLWTQLNDFLSVLFEKRHVNFMITERDSEVLTEKKINYMNMFLMSLCNSLQMAFKQLDSTKLMELIYHLCKHGSYSIGENLLTQAELDLACLSETEGYIRCDKNLQKSSIISLLLIKIVLYSTLLKPHTMTYKYSMGDNEYFESNIKLVGNIIYRIITKIQRNAIKHAGDTYQVGNWRRLKTKFIIKSTKSLTVKQGFYQKEFISGLINEKAIQQEYYNPQWNEIEVTLQRIIEGIHEKIRRFHQKCRKTCF